MEKFILESEAARGWETEGVQGDQIQFLTDTHIGQADLHVKSLVTTHPLV